MPRNDKIMIFPHDGSDPVTGLFAITLGKGLPQRALSIRNPDGYWSVHLDGNLVASPSQDWRLAFGRFAKQTIFLGERLHEAAYEKLLRLRIGDLLASKDLSKPVNLNEMEPPI